MSVPKPSKHEAQASEYHHEQYEHEVQARDPRCQSDIHRMINRRLVHDAVNPRYFIPSIDHRTNDRLGVIYLDA